MLDSERQVSSYGQQKLQHMLAEERRLADKYRQQRDDALMQRWVLPLPLRSPCTCLWMVCICGCEFCGVCG